MGGRRIAILDNEPSYLEIIQDLLQDEGFEVVTLGELRAGYAVVQQQHPDLLIVDLLQQREPLGLALLAASARTRSCGSCRSWWPRPTSGP